MPWPKPKERGAQSFDVAGPRGPPKTMSAEKILPLEKASETVQALKRQGKRVVFTNGCFDLLHLGHVRFLSEARKLGDVLIVAMNSDRSVRALKGADRPRVPEDERAEILAALESVDFVTVFDDLTPHAVISSMLPQILVKGDHWRLEDIVGRAEVEAAGGKVVRLPLVRVQIDSCTGPVVLSTSTLIETIIKKFGNQP